MKIKIYEAMDALHKNDNIKEGYSNIEVKLHHDDEGLERLTWKIYAYDAKSESEKSGWSGGFPTFQEALDDIVQKFEDEREPIDPFVEK